MAMYEGSNGSVKLLDGTGTLTNVAQVRSWTISATRDTVETTSMSSSGVRTFVKGLETWSGSMEIVYDDSTSTEVNAALNPSTDTVITGEWYPDNSVAGTKFAGTIIVTEFSVTATYDGITTASVSFQGTGAMTTTKYSA